ncbi:hypothetical protein [Methanomethylovorans sp.]|uniref:hypothetical protein n=1 Tax=Methanomethylovorans sp. TaxID=2758717 RepID=UPI002FDCEA33
MKLFQRIRVTSLLIAIVMLATLFVPAVSAKADALIEEEKSENNTLDEMSINYTTAQLQNMYKKYNVTDNDLKFANDELPNYLEGTILDSDLRVIASETGEAPENLKQGEDYDILITEKEMVRIMESARDKYIQKYGVDPNNPKVDVVNGIALPKEEAKKLVINDQASIDSENPVFTSENSLIHNEDFAMTFQHVYRNPRKINGNIEVHIFPAKDSSHKPIEAYSQDTTNALSRFQAFSVTMTRFWHYNFWDASDTGSTTSSVLLNDLEEDTTWVIDNNNDIVVGWVKSMDNNGRAWRPGSFSVCGTTAAGLDWPHDSIVQHEVSHNFDANDHYTVDCIMDYEDAYSGVDTWCYDCRNIVRNGILN